VVSVGHLAVTAPVLTDGYMLASVLGGLGCSPQVKTMGIQIIDK